MKRGDEVAYYSTDVFAEKIALTGARYRPYRNGLLADLRQLPERLEELSWLLMRTTEDLLGGELAAIRAERPDYLITDSVAPWGQWLGEVLDVPVVTSVSTFAFNRHVLAFAVSKGVRPKSAEDRALQDPSHLQGDLARAAAAAGDMPSRDPGSPGWFSAARP